MITDRRSGAAVGLDARLVAAMSVAAILAAACAAHDTPSAGPDPVDITPEDRVVALETTGCGHASATSGSGVLIDAGHILTVAHVVAGASDVDVVIDGVARDGEIVAYDPARDLALVSVSDADAVDVPPLRHAPADAGTEGRIVGGAASGTASFAVRRSAIIEIDQIRSPGNTVRRALELGVDTERGDSGAGAYDQDGGFIGIVFALSADTEGRTWATAAEEVAAFLADDTVGGRFACEVVSSRLVPVPEVGTAGT